MDEIMEYLNAVYKLVTNVSVQGADVERMAKVFTLLRQAYAKCGEVKSEEDEQE